MSDFLLVQCTGICVSVCTCKGEVGSVKSEHIGFFLRGFNKV